MKVIEELYPNWRNQRIHESSPSPGGASGVLNRECKNYIGSQYFMNEPFGKTFNDFRNEDLEHQTFDDASFDIVVTQDVFEHIYHPKPAFREISRTLAPGGSHIFTVPLINHHMPTEVWATQNSDGSPNFLKEPEWHENPVSKSGSPVTMHWGMDIGEFIERETGDKTEILYQYRPESGIMGEFCEVLVTRKAGVSVA